jgi:hypothetical protein
VNISSNPSGTLAAAEGCVCCREVAGGSEPEVGIGVGEGADQSAVDEFLLPLG